MNPDEAAFLRLICERRDDDGPRLLYADWLAESGEVERAEYVRTACAVAALPEATARRADLHAHAALLLKAHRDEWLRPIRDLWRRPGRGLLGLWGAAHADPVRVARFHRGLVDELYLEADAFLDRAADLVAIVPLRSLKLEFPRTPQACSITFARLTGCSHLARLEALEIGTLHLGGGELRQFLDTADLGGLREFSVNSRDLNRSDAEQLAAAPMLARLRTLRLQAAGNVGTAGVARLAASEFVGGLEALTLRNVGLDHAGMAALALSSLSETLRELDVPSNPLGPEGVLPLVAAAWPELTGLNLADANLGDSGAATLAGSPLLRRLHRLSLAANGITDIGAMVLADSPHWVGGTRIVLAGNPINERVRTALTVRYGDQVDWKAG